MAGSRGRAVAAVVTDERVDVPTLARAVASDASGAVVTFVGAVRDHDTPGRGTVVRLDYEAHPSAPAVMQAVCDDVAARHEGCVVAAAHRVGSLGVGEVALGVAAAAAHRREAFAAAEALVDEVKRRLPVWKHQVFADGSDEWVGLGEAVPVPNQ